MKQQTNTRTARRIITAVICVILTAAMTLGGSVNAAEALQWALEPTSVYKSIYHAGGDYWTVTDAQGRMGLITSDGKIIADNIGEDREDNYVFNHGYGKFNIVHEKFVSICRNGKYGLVDANNNTVIPFEYDT